MHFVCIECVKDKNLQKFVSDNSVNGTCSVCEIDNTKVVDYESNEFFQQVKSVIRFNFSEWEYNRHMGGDELEDLFYGESNLFFDQTRAASEEVYDNLVLGVTQGEVYEEYDKGVSLFSGYSGGFQNMPLASLNSSLDHDIMALSSRLKNENYFDVESDLKAIINNYASVATTKYSKDDAFYRARIGVEDQKRSYDAGYETELHFEPYSQGKIGAPPPQYASSGRINRPGVSFMYCATDKYTAISEVRPHPGDLVSTGKFVLRREVRLFDLSKSLLGHFGFSDELLDQFIPFHTLTILINKVVPPSERQHYSITQLIADCIRQLGFDGIVFSSTVGNGKNLVFFNYSILDFCSDDNEVARIEQVKYDYSSVPLIEEDGLYL
ncbi:RES family NAD+ phosphorylase [Vibrio parahaemolyticus]|uniref:RES family NAD+ phosphorylase n=1 Tax=Vibrio sp. Y20_XG_PY13 TaxID=2957761 RepID=UPI0020A2CD7F|nr:RES family NAD+ phosphorylase [Vibrio sp. Y20_XG_PY13]ELA8383156.1 RES family NAD+ phosphorylase [Vibrio parahaemolyticus]